MKNKLQRKTATIIKMPMAQYMVSTEDKNNQYPMRPKGPSTTDATPRDSDDHTYNLVCDYELTSDILNAKSLSDVLTALETYLWTY